MAVIKGSPGGVALDVDANHAAYVRQRDANGNDIAKIDKSAISAGVLAGLPVSGADKAIARVVRSMSDGAIADGRPMLALYDPVEGAAVNTNTWTQATTTMTIVQAASYITINNASSVATTVGAMHTSQHQVCQFGRSKMLFRHWQRHTAHFTGNLIELGFGAPATNTTASIGTGACWRKDGTGQYVPVLSNNGAETLGTAVSNATFLVSIPVTDFAQFEVEIDGSGAWFRIISQSGVSVAEQRVDFPGSLGDWYNTHFNVFYRTYNVSAVSTAVQVFAGEAIAYILDMDHNKSWQQQMSGNGWNSSQSPTAYTQAPIYVNNTAPTTGTPTNTTSVPGTGLGGHSAWNNAGTSFAASDTLDLIIFSFQVPTPYAFYLTGVRLSTVNLGAANGAAIYVVEYSLAVNSSAVSLATAAPNAPRFIPLGIQSLANAAAIGAAFDKDTVWTPGTPVCIQPGRFIQVVARVIGASAATASQVIRTIATLDGYFE